MNCCKEWMPLYGVTDRAWLGDMTLAQQAEAALKGGVTCLQLREKELDRDAFLQEARNLKKLCDRYGVPLIVNDDVKIAIQSDADGVHIGQQDEDAALVRLMIGPEKILGVSAQTVEQAVKAEAEGADYLGVGAVFYTGTKPDAEAVSLETLRDICRSVSIPVVAIGGISRETLPLLEGSGVSGVAVVSAIFAAKDIEGAARALREQVQEVCGV
ncbi:MAG: thiamine phosphate synthase [Lachnospiraceae bacterium]|nr:thiamine phosphate synthase [Lachnospiraceae bacterium]